MRNTVKWLEAGSGDGALAPLKAAPSHPKPFAFGGLMGWLHQAAGRRAVLMCNTIGYQALYCRPMLRALADMIAAAGMPCLRFDYPSEGDSLGQTDEPGRVAAWIDAVTAAIDFLESLDQVTEVAIVGLGFGALAAREAAKRRCDSVTRLVHLAPPASGRALVRELRAEAGLLATDKGQCAETEDGSLSIAGFEYSRETLDALAQLTLKGDAGPAEVLVLAPHESAQSLNLRTVSRKFSDFNATLAQRVVPRIPHEDWRTVVKWLSLDTSPAVPAAPAPAAPAVLVGDGFVETALRFGGDDELAGVLCAPPEGSDACVIFVNTGANSHIGWARGAVTTGRRLASEAGIASLRMDLRGLGESVALPGGAFAALYDTERTRDIDEAIAMLKGLNYRKIMLVGQCSGAFTALHAALRNEEVEGLVLVNLVRFTLHNNETVEALLSQTGRSSAAYFDMLRNGTVFLRLLRGEVPMSGILRAARKFAHRVRLAASDAVDWFTAPAPKPGSPEAWIHQLAARGVKTHLLLSEADMSRDEFALYFGRRSWRWRRVRGFELSVLVDADHNLSARSARSILYQHVRTVANA